VVAILGVIKPCTCSYAVHYIFDTPQLHIPWLTWWFGFRA